MLVIVVDDRNARYYLDRIASQLRSLGIDSNNIHTNTYGVPDFMRPGEVTLSTVHKAKGNEAFVVHVAGCDALFHGTPTVQERNVLFTAMTRAKGILRLYGSGEPAKRLKAEVESALAHFPRLQFVHPGPERVKQIRRDWRNAHARKDRAKSEIERLLESYSPEELMEFLKHRKLRPEADP